MATLRSSWGRYPRIHSRSLISRPSRPPIWRPRRAGARRLAPHRLVLLDSRDHRSLDGFALVPRLHRGCALLARSPSNTAPQLCGARTVMTTPTAPDQAAGVQGRQGQAFGAMCRTSATRTTQGVRGVGHEHLAHFVDAARAGGVPPACAATWRSCSPACGVAVRHIPLGERSYGHIVMITLEHHTLYTHLFSASSSLHPAARAPPRDQLPLLSRSHPCVSPSAHSTSALSTDKVQVMSESSFIHPKIDPPSMLVILACFSTKLVTVLFLP
jgi:hypothetical protein